MEQTDSNSLLNLAGSEPNQAVTRARRILERGTDGEKVAALHALGLAYRNLREPARSVEYLRQSLDEAERLAVDQSHRWAIRADLAVSVTDLGDPVAGLEHVGGVAGPDPVTFEALKEPVVARVHHIRGLIHQRMGASDKARLCYDRALAGYRAHDNQLGLGHVLGNLGILTTYEGDIEKALDLLDQAEEAYANAGQELWVALTMLNRGWTTGCGGNLARALRQLAEAETRLRKLDVPDGLRVLSRGEVLLKAGLYSTARTELVDAVEEFEQQGLSIDRSETLILAAQAAELDGDLDEARLLAQRAIAELDDQARPGWSAAARAGAFGIQCRSGGPPNNAQDQAEDLCRRLQQAGQSGMVPMVQLSAVWALTEQGDVKAASGLIDKIRDHCESAESKSMLALCEARVLESDGRTVAAIAALDRGYRELEAELELLAGVDVAAMAAAALVRIIDAAKRLLAPTDQSEAFLLWADRGRQIGTWRWPRLEEPRIAMLLNRVRALSSEDGADGSDRRSDTLGELRRQIQELRWQQEQLPAATDAASSFDGRSGVNAPIVDLTTADGRWYLGSSGRDGEPARHWQVGIDSARLVAAVRLGRIFQTSSPTMQQQLVVQLDEVLADLDRELEPLLPDDVEQPVIISIDDDISDLPWALLPSLWPRPFSVLPTHRHLWSQPGRLSSRPGISMLRGPGLRSLGAEVDNLADGSRLLSNVADIDQLGEALDRRVVHIAAHGGPEPDNPLFNWLEFDCGRIFLHDLMFLDKVPETIVLAACYTGQAQRFGPGGSASFANGFLGIGSRWVVSAGTALPDDDDLVGFATQVLSHIGDGVEPPYALCLARRAAADRLTNPAAIAFTCYGG